MNEELITLNQLKEYDRTRADNMVKKHTATGRIDENLIFRATQHTFDYSESAFDGLFYEVAPFMESDQIPEGAKLIYNDNGTLRFTSSLPPYSGLQFGSPESVAANKGWFDGIEWMPETVALADFTYSTPVMTVKNADGETREVATRAEQSFADHKGEAVDTLLDRKAAENASGLLAERTRAQGVEATKQDNLVSGTNIKTVNGQNILGSGNLHIDTIPTGGTDGQVLTSKGDGTTVWKAPSQSFYLPVGMIIELDNDVLPNGLFAGTWNEI